MATLLSRDVLVLRPDHLILLLRDVDCDAGVGAGEAITRARDSIAASSGYVVYVEAAQNLIALRAEVEVWSAEPDDSVPTGEWTGPVLLESDCPTGNLLVGDDMGNAISEILPPQGPGRYNVGVYHRGRDAALEHEKQLTAALAAGASGQRIDELRAGWEGTEQYLFRVWWQAPLSDADDDT